LRAAELRPPALVGGLGRVALGELPGGRRRNIAVHRGLIAGARTEQQAQAD